MAATNRNLKKAVKEGTFREDLFYRLNVVSITLPSLKDRPEDLIELAEFFLTRLVRDKKRPKVSLTSQAVEAILQYSWPGNVRELENVLARAVILNTGLEITSEQLPLEIAIPDTGPLDRADHKKMPYYEAIENYSRALILNALHRNDGNKTKAAEELGIQRTYLNTIMKRKNIQWNESDSEE
ncbi:MAG: sigma 54-interacting transcriptional regulator [Nitrospirae bacterium]|nr:sigma 54-interacting transcriptional regulator [Nitrospirota bacterium]MDA1304605.1 sigma 54-interacting transcriptional regulator [Nitrospirota bacterium]